MNLLIFHNKSEYRFEFTNGTINACIDYCAGSGTIVFHHSNLPDELEDLLIGYVVEYAKEHHLKIIATCPHVRKYIRFH